MLKPSPILIQRHPPLSLQSAPVFGQWRRPNRRELLATLGTGGLLLTLDGFRRVAVDTLNSDRFFKGLNDESDRRSQLKEDRQASVKASKEALQGPDMEKLTDQERAQHFQVLDADAKATVDDAVFAKAAEQKINDHNENYTAGAVRNTIELFTGALVTLLGYVPLLRHPKQAEPSKTETKRDPPAPSAP